MNKNLELLKGNVKSLVKAIEAANIPRKSFQDHGWNQLSLDKEHLVYLAKNLQSDVETICSQEFEKEVSYYEEDVLASAEHIGRLTQNIKTYLTDRAEHLLYSAPNASLTILAIHSDLKQTFLGWDALEQKKLLPHNLTRRIRATEARLNSIDTSSNDIESKVDRINEAYDAAESLPTYLQEILDGKSDLEEKLRKAEETLKKIENAEHSARASLEDNLNHLKSAARNAQTTEVLKEKCDDNLQITTTQGLAAGFDQKANSLSSSINYWVLGLVAALGIGGFFGSQQVQKISLMLDANLEIGTGTAILHTLLAFFSIGGPLWFAWLATQQINQRFKLSEDYAYKATVAKSYTGFSKHANRFDDETAERLFNSTLDRLDEMPLRLVDGKDYNSPWHEFIDSEAFKKALDMVPELADKASTFASRTKLKEKPTVQENTAANPSVVKDQPKEPV